MQTFIQIRYRDHQTRGIINNTVLSNGGPQPVILPLGSMIFHSTERYKIVRYGYAVTSQALLVFLARDDVAVNEQAPTTH